MKPLQNRGKTLVAATLLVTSFGAAPITQGFGGEFRSEAVASVRRPMQIHGSVVCAKCSLGGATSAAAGARVLPVLPQERTARLQSHVGQPADQVSRADMAAAAMAARVG